MKWCLLQSKTGRNSCIVSTRVRLLTVDANIKDDDEVTVCLDTAGLLLKFVLVTNYHLSLANA